MADNPFYYGLAQKYGGEEGVDPHLIEAVVEAESGGDRNARSGVGAQGLMQIMPGTGSGLARDYHMQHPNLFDPDTNVRLGTHYLGELLHEFGGNVDKAVAGYNAGGGAVEHYHGVPPYRETQNYVKTVESNLQRLEGEPQTVNWTAFEKDTMHNLMDTIRPYSLPTSTFMTTFMDALKSAKPWERIYDLFSGKKNG